MSRSDERLDQRVQQLAAEGGDPLRIELLQCASQFKRSWVQMAQALVKVQQRRSYEAWGYGDLYDYCAEELLLKRGTVDKLTGSFVAIERHAPALLKADGLEQQIPSPDAVRYFAQAVGEQPVRGKAKRIDQVAPEVIDNLKQAVFDEQRPVAAIRRDFNELLYAKSEEQRALEGLEKARTEVRKLAELLPILDGLSARRLSQVETTLDELGGDLDRLIERFQGRLQGAGRRAG